MAIARYTLAVDRRFTRRGEDNNGATADFIPCVAFGRSAEFAEKYFRQGLKVVVTGRIQTGSYTNNEVQNIINLISQEYTPEADSEWLSTLIDKYHHPNR